MNRFILLILSTIKLNIHGGKYCKNRSQRIISIITILILLLNISVYASDQTSESTNQLAQLEEAREYISKINVDNSKIKSMMEEEDMSREDAEYYYKLTELFKYLDENKIVLDLESVEAMSDSAALKDKKDTKNKILQLDLPALKQSLDSLSVSQADKSKLEKMIAKDKDKNTAKYVLKTAKGAELSYSYSKTDTSSEFIDQISDESVLYENSDGQVLGYKEAVYKTGSNPNGGRVIGDTEWKGVYTSAYAKIWLNDKIDVDISADTADVVYVNGSGSSYGVLMFQNSTGGATNTSHGSGSLPAVTSNQVTYAVSASVGYSVGISVAAEVSLSFSVNAGANFTFHIYDKQWGDGDWEYVAGRYF